MRFILAFCITLLSLASGIQADEVCEALSARQTVYVPIYPKVLIGSKEYPFTLTAALSIRNTDMHNPLLLRSAKYYDNEGKTLKEYVTEATVLAPLASKHFVVKESAEAGGFGSNFIVKWEAKKAINTPIIQSVMVGTQSGQGITVVGDAKVIVESSKTAENTP